MRKEPFTTLEQVREIAKKYPTPFIYMMRKV